VRGLATSTALSPVSARDSLPPSAESPWRLLEKKAFSGRPDSLGLRCWPRERLRTSVPRAPSSAPRPSARYHDWLWLIRLPSARLSTQASNRGTRCADLCSVNRPLAHPRAPSCVFRAIWPARAKDAHRPFNPLPTAAPRTRGRFVPDLALGWWASQPTLRRRSPLHSARDSGLRPRPTDTALKRLRHPLSSNAPQPAWVIRTALRTT